MENLELFGDLDWSPTIAQTHSTFDVMSFVSGGSRLVNGETASLINSRGSKVQRFTSAGDMVDVYRNINKPEFFSAKQVKGADKNLVSCYAKVIVLKDVSFKVSEATRKKINVTKRKAVHAFVRGEFFECSDGAFNPDSSFKCVTYNPYVCAWFYDRESGEELPRDASFKYAVLHGANVYLSNG